MATLSSWTNDGLRYAHGIGLAASGWRHRVGGIALCPSAVV